MFKIHSNKSPATLKEIMPQTTRQRTNRNLRSDSNPTIMKYNTTSYNDSFFPATIKAWNQLPERTRNAGSIELFKEYITPEKGKIPNYIYSGERKAQVLQTRMRLRRSNLREELYEVNLADSPSCRCGYHLEDAEHYLKDCPLYNNTRLLLNIDLRVYSTEELLEGSSDLSSKENFELFKEVQNYITRTGRFD